MKVSTSLGSPKSDSLVAIHMIYFFFQDFEDVDSGFLYLSFRAVEFHFPLVAEPGLQKIVIIFAEKMYSMVLKSVVMVTYFLTYLMQAHSSC